MLFGTTGTARAKGPHGTDPLVAGAVRVAIAGLLLSLIASHADRAWWRGLPRWPLLGGAAGVAVYQLAFFEGVARTGVAIGTVVAIGSGPVFAGVLGWFLLRERPPGAWYVATLLAVAGGAIISLAGSSLHTDPLGVGLTLLAGFGYAAYTMLSRQLIVGGARARAVMAGAFGIAALLLVPTYFVRDTDWLFSTRGSLLALYLGTLPTTGAYLLFSNGLRTLTGSTVTTLVLAEPVTAVLLARLVLNETLVAAQWGGIAMVLVGIGLLSRARA